MKGLLASTIASPQARDVFQEQSIDFACNHGNRYGFQSPFEQLDATDAAATTKSLMPAMPAQQQPFPKKLKTLPRDLLDDKPLRLRGGGPGDEEDEEMPQMPPAAHAPNTKWHLGGGGGGEGGLITVEVLSFMGTQEEGWKYAVKDVASDRTWPAVTHFDLIPIYDGSTILPSEWPFVGDVDRPIEELIETLVTCKDESMFLSAEKSKELVKLHKELEKAKKMPETTDEEKNAKDKAVSEAESKLKKASPQKTVWSIGEGELQEDHFRLQLQCRNSDKRIKYLQNQAREHDASDRQKDDKIRRLEEKIHELEKRDDTIVSPASKKRKSVDDPQFTLDYEDDVLDSLDEFEKKTAELFGIPNSDDLINSPNHQKWKQGFLNDPEKFDDMVLSVNTITKYDPLVQPLAIVDLDIAPETEQFGTLLSYYFDKDGDRKDLTLEDTLEEFNCWLHKYIYDKNNKVNSGCNSKKIFAFLSQRLLTESPLQQQKVQALYLQFQNMLMLESFKVNSDGVVKSSAKHLLKLVEAARQVLDLKQDDDETKDLQRNMKVLLTILYTLSSCFKIDMDCETKKQKISAVKLLVQNYVHDLKRVEDEKKAAKNQQSTDKDNDPWASIRGSSSSSDTNARVRAARERRSFGGATTPPPGL